MDQLLWGMFPAPFYILVTLKSMKHTNFIHCCGISVSWLAIYTHEDILFIPIWNALVDSFYYKNPRICAKAPHGTITGTEMMSTEDDRENEGSVNY